jgi:hypothetical protein
VRVRERARSGLEIVLIDIWEGTEPRPEVERFCEMWGIKGPILLDPGGELAGTLGVRGVPTNVAVDSAMALLRPEEEAKVREWFTELERPVQLLVALGPEETPRAGSGDVDFGAEMVRVCEGLAELGDLVSCCVEQEPEGFPRFPAVSIRPDGRDAGVRYDGLPWGYELGSLVGAIVDAGRAESTLRPESLTALGQLDRDLALEVFVTPT